MTARSYPVLPHYIPWSRADVNGPRGVRAALDWRGFMGIAQDKGRKVVPDMNHAHYYPAAVCGCPWSARCPIALFMPGWSAISLADCVRADCRWLDPVVKRGWF